MNPLPDQRRLNEDHIQISEAQEHDLKYAGNQLVPSDPDIRIMNHAYGSSGINNQNGYLLFIFHIAFQRLKSSTEFE